MAIEVMSVSVLILSLLLCGHLLYLTKSARPSGQLPVPPFIRRLNATKPKIVVQTDAKEADIEERRMKEKGWD